MRLWVNNINKHIKYYVMDNAQPSPARNFGEIKGPMPNRADLRYHDLLARRVGSDAVSQSSLRKRSANSCLLIKLGELRVGIPFSTSSAE
jgi:hypothetical protein